MTRIERMPVITGFHRIFGKIPTFLNINNVFVHRAKHQAEQLRKKEQLSGFVTKMSSEFNIQPSDQKLLEEYIALRIEYYKLLHKSMGKKSNKTENRFLRLANEIRNNHPELYETISFSIDRLISTIYAPN